MPWSLVAGWGRGGAQWLQVEVASSSESAAVAEAQQGPDAQLSPEGHPGFRNSHLSQSSPPSPSLGSQEARVMTELGERNLDSGDSVVKKQGLQGGCYGGSYKGRVPKGILYFQRPGDDR